MTILVGCKIIDDVICEVVVDVDNIDLVNLGMIFSIIMIRVIILR